MSTKGPVTGRAFDYLLFKRIFSYVLPYRRLFYITLTITVILAFLTPARPFLIQYTFDNYILNADEVGLLNMSLLMIGLLIFESCLQFFSSYYTNFLGQNVIKDIRQQLFEHISHFRLKYFDNTPIGTLVTRNISDIQTISEVFSQGLLEIVGDILKLIIIIAVMLITDWRLTLISLSTIPVLLVATYIFKNAIKDAFQSVRNEIAKLNAFVQEHITGISIVQIFNREKEEQKRFEDINARHRDANIRSIWHYSVFFPIVEILSALSIGLLIWWGAREALIGDVTIGTILAFILYINLLFRPIRQLADRFNTLQMGMVGSERVFKILDTEDKEPGSGNIIAADLKGNIEFKNVWFAYNDENWILKNINYKIKHGETIALVGPTGAGKSSIINLISRLYEHSKGDILVNDVIIRDYDLKFLRSKIAVVLQDVFLFSDTIANNITLNNNSISREEIIEASKELGAHDFIMRLPGNYDYNVMERGGMLSVGQRQLISFVRAYIFNPSILILDEATSSVDTETERLLQKATRKLTRQRTSIIIAHRLATVQNADKILVLENGEIIESGSHQELLQQKGHYKTLYDLQFME